MVAGAAAREIFRLSQRPDPGRDRAFPRARLGDASPVPGLARSRCRACCLSPWRSAPGRSSPSTGSNWAPPPPASRLRCPGRSSWRRSGARAHCSCSSPLARSGGLPTTASGRSYPVFMYRQLGLSARQRLPVHHPQHAGRGGDDARLGPAARPPRQQIGHGGGDPPLAGAIPRLDFPRPRQYLAALRALDLERFHLGRLHARALQPAAEDSSRPRPRPSPSASTPR